ncbi:SpoIVB peptidase S55 domain-containing protein [Halocella sp. SP3-1]|uniref:SpoIVB peptidase S55 domain-containing protein n=1 Tax=Halocella sp. SP3-1 TaxID=2382161 RepID=UPI000F7D8D97|nr:SpoIVB peptidase S55 domain-containing protein [Halocella sp. SP3-1]
MFVLLIMILISGFSVAEEIMPLTEIEAGMQGKAKTVFYGDKVEEFPVEIIDIMPDQGLNRDLILIRAGGEKIDEIGGIAAGMSGSPVYIEGKLIGAIGYGWSFSEGNYALVTPIEDMLALINSEDNEGIENSNLAERGLSTPLLVSGLTGRSFDRLKKDLESLGLELTPYNVSTGGRAELKTKLEPGSAVAVQLVRGDINIGSIGTVSYLDESGNILAFGHPFFNKGEVDYMLSSATIRGVIPSMQQPFKLGSPNKELLGSITVDRGAGIAGKLEKYSRVIPLRIRVSDQEREVENKVNAQLIRDEDLITSLVTNIGLESLDATLDRIGEGTARTRFKITANGLPELSIERENMYYSRHDIASLALLDLYQVMDIITGNPFQEVNLIDIQYDVEVDHTAQVALVQEARVINQEIRPGDQVEVEVILHPYRGEVFTKNVMIEIPEDTQPGMASMVIDGGFTGQSYQHLPEDSTQEDDLNQAVVQGYKDFPSIIEDYLEKPKNNDLIIQVHPGYTPDDIEAEDENKQGHEAGDQEDERKENKEESPENTAAPDQESKEEGERIDNREIEETEIKEIVETDYVLEGNLSLDINIKDINSKNTPDITEERVEKGE